MSITPEDRVKLPSKKNGKNTCIYENRKLLLHSLTQDTKTFTQVYTFSQIFILTQYFQVVCNKCIRVLYLF